jgi:hypothetical protein
MFAWNPSDRLVWAIIDAENRCLNRLESNRAWGNYNDARKWSSAYNRLARLLGSM